jgi:predicted Zn-dependent protease
MAADVPAIQGALGCASLWLGDSLRAARVLGRLEDHTVYHAMALIGKKGGLAKARTLLAKEEKLSNREAEPGALYLAALAFEDAGQNERAHQLLSRAVELAPSALDAAFAPDPAVCMVRDVLAALEALPDSDGQRRAFREAAAIDLATLAMSSGRRGEAVRIAESLLESERARSAALRILVLVENASQARRALRRVERILRDEPKAEDILVARVILLLRAGETGRAQKALEALPIVEAADLQSELDRARAELALLRKDKADALRYAEAAVRSAPKSDAAVAVYVRALVANSKTSRALSFARALIKRKPRGLNPFRLFAEVNAAAGAKAKAEGDVLRAKAFDMELAKIERAVSVREEVLLGVRDAESGMGATGLEALRAEHPSLSLPLDLALARMGRAGSAIEARRRILTACAPRLRSILVRKQGWDFVTVSASLYGQTERLEAPLSAADPGRCAARKPSRRRMRR